VSARSPSEPEQGYTIQSGRFHKTAACSAAGHSGLVFESGSAACPAPLKQRPKVGYLARATHPINQPPRRFSPAPQVAPSIARCAKDIEHVIAYRRTVLGLHSALPRPTGLSLLSGTPSAIVFNNRRWRQRCAAPGLHA